MDSHFILLCINCVWLLWSPAQEYTSNSKQERKVMKINNTKLYPLYVVIQNEYAILRYDGSLLLILYSWVCSQLKVPYRTWMCGLRHSTLFALVSLSDKLLKYRGYRFCKVNAYLLELHAMYSQNKMVYKWISSWSDSSTEICALVSSQFL